MKKAIQAHLSALAKGLEFRPDQSHQARSDGWDYDPKNGIHSTYKAHVVNMSRFDVDDHAFAKVLEGALEAQHPAYTDAARNLVAERCLAAIACTLFDIEDVRPYTARLRNIVRRKFWNSNFQWAAIKAGWGLFEGRDDEGNNTIRLQRVDEKEVFESDEDAIHKIAGRIAYGHGAKLELRAFCYLAACHEPDGTVCEEPMVTPEQRIIAMQLEESLLCSQRIGLLDMIAMGELGSGACVEGFLRRIDQFTKDNGYRR